MIRAIFFDFYSVWAPDRFSEYVAGAQASDPAAAQAIRDALQQYYLGMIDITQLVDNIRFKLNHPELDVSSFVLNEADISADLVDFMRGLHGHFVKLGVLAELGRQEYELLQAFNDHNQLFEVITGPLPQALPASLLTQEVFANALQLIGEPPRSALVVSGHDDYLRFAAGLGLQTLKFESFPQLRGALDRLLANPDA